MNQPQPFYVGLCMAGAVSAGAYTAGVMDFLIEALEEWEFHRGRPGVPNHRVEIPVIGGASAGGMTGIITASAIHNRIKPVTEILPSEFANPIPSNKFWHSWVDMTDSNMFPHLLDTADISKGHILSLFNSSFIDDIAERALKISEDQKMERPYFSKHLKIFTTITSLRGLSYNIDFRGSNPQPDKYCVTQHNDYVNFILNQTAYGNDGWIPLDFNNPLSVSLAKDAAMATGAFPIGLRSRKVSRPKKYLNDHPWLKEVTRHSPVDANPFETLCVDGGMINNEPFEKVKEVLKEITNQDTDKADNYNGFRSTVLMVDPFPSAPPVYNGSDKLSHVMGSTLSALINQVRVKYDHLEHAMDKRMAGQFLIAPSREVPKLDGSGSFDALGAPAIACGAFDGFSGFFNKEFRIHDYFLGRANCEKFLRDYFTVPKNTDNLVTAGYANLSEEDLQQYYSHKNEGHLPIIPVMLPRRSEMYMPTFSSGTNWPVLQDADIDRFKVKTQDRVYSVIMNFAKYSWWLNGFLAIGTWAVLKRKIGNEVLGIIKQSLADHHLLRSKTFKPRKKETLTNNLAVTDEAEVSV